MFVYENETYDDEEPWKGLFRGELIVKVSYRKWFIEPPLITPNRVSSIYLHLQALSIKTPKLHDQEMPRFMV